MTRTYILAVLVLIAAAVVFRMKFMRAHNDLETAKERIRHVEQQPVARAIAPPARPANDAPARQAPAQEAQPETSQQPAAQPTAEQVENERVARLTKGTFTVVDGTIVYSADAQLDIGHGMLVSSPSGVMVSDEAQQHISGDLVIETQNDTTTMQNAFLTVDKAHVETTSDSSVTVKKEGPN
jgi:type IV secretory pathway VirB10-like protein